MNFCGIICEFNPFHNGHEHLIKQIKQKLNTNIVCLMSGNFVQRGEMAIIDKHQRATYALEAGADMVVELPAIYAVSNAENFAFGAVKTLLGLQISHLAFGIENTSLEILDKIAKLKVENSETFQNSFKNEIQNGINFNTALKRSIAKEFENSDEILQILNKPNNILAIEYLTAIKKLGAKIEILAINRCDNGFYSNQNKENFLSASAIREKLYKGEDISKFVPKFALPKNILSKTEFEKFEILLLYKLRTTPAEVLELFYDYNEGIEYKIKSAANKFADYDCILKEVASPRYREARVKKLLLYPLLGISKNTYEFAKKTKPCAKLLAIKKDKKILLSNIRKNKINLLVTNKDYLLLNNNQRYIIDIDYFASNIYSIIKGEINDKDKKIGVIFK